MILIDFSQVMISNLFVLPLKEIQEKGETQLPDMNGGTIIPGKPDEKRLINEDLLRHMVLNSIRYYKTKFGNKYGRIVICADNRHYWRKDVFEYYKAGRKKNRDKSSLDWHLIFESLNKLREELVEFTPYQVLNVDGAEADDLISIAVKKFQHEKILILSGDHDFQQLQKFSHVEQYAPIQKKNIICENPLEYLKEHIMLGDVGDGIPNFKSPDDTFVTGIRQISIRRNDLERWKKDEPENFCTNSMLRGYKRNERLIDFDFIPQNLQEAIVSELEKPFKESRKNLLQYFVKFKLINLLDHIHEF